MPEAMDTESDVSPSNDHKPEDGTFDRYRTLERDYRHQCHALQEAVESKTTLQHELEATREKCGHVISEKSMLQEKLDSIIDSTNKETQRRVEKIVQLEYDNKRYQEMTMRATNSWSDTAKQMEAVANREKHALTKISQYEELISDLRGQIEKLSEPIDEQLILRKNNTVLSTTANALTKSPNDLASMVNDLSSHSTWANSNAKNIIFIAVSSTEDGRPRGFECEIAEDRTEGLRTVEYILELAKHCLDDIRAWDTHGKALTIASISYIFEVAMENTVFVGSDSVFQTFLDKRANENVWKVPRKIKSVKRIKVKIAGPGSEKDFKEVIEWEGYSGSDENEDASFRQRKIPSLLPAIEAPRDAESGEGSR
jgi:hypothetical protein